MANVPSRKRQTTGLVSKGHNVPVRLITFDVDFADDFTMANATDVIQLGTLPAGTLVVAGWIKQVEAGTGSGTLTLRLNDGTPAALTGTFASTAAAGTVGVSTLAAPYVCDAVTEVDMLGATAVRTDGKAQVCLAVVEGFAPTFPAGADRDYLA